MTMTSNRAVYKYPLDLNAPSYEDGYAVDLPDGATLLHVDQDPAHTAGTGHLAVWADVDTEADPERRVPLVVLSTGHPMPNGIDASSHLGSVVDGPYVWHVFVGAAR